MIATKRTFVKPIGWEKLKEFEFRKLFFTYEIKDGSVRQFFYNDDNIREGVFNCRLFELSDGIGIAMVDDWKSDKLTYYRFGSRLKWDDFEQRQNKLKKT
jgi:hypothetical protein